MFFFFNRTTLPVFVTYLTGALYLHTLWFYKHQHDNPVRSKLSVACQRWWFVWRFWFVPSVPGYTYTPCVFCHCAYHLRMELSDGGFFPNLVRNCRWTIVPPTIILNNPVQLCHLGRPIQSLTASLLKERWRFLFDKQLGVNCRYA